MTHADELLLLIEEHTHADGRYWVPQHLSQFCVRLDRHVACSGGGSASALRGLERRGLITWETGADIPYAASITEDGKLYAQTIA